MSEPATAATIFERMLKNLEARKKNDPRAEIGNNTAYNLLKVKVEDWLATEEGKFAHSIKIPNPVPPDSGYRRGMTQQQYFEHLCKNEAGEFIFATADNVDGVYQLRPRKIYTDWEWQHLYAIEDPYGHWAGEVDDEGYQLVHPLLYAFLETSVEGRKIPGLGMKSLRDSSIFQQPPPWAVVARFSGDDGQSVRSMKLAFDTQKRSQYGFIWRGIRRPHDREMGIAGGELIVLDLKSGEVMGVRRGYSTWNRSWTGRVCPRYGYGGGQDKTTYFTAWFLGKVARPAKWKEFFARQEKFRVMPK